MLAAVLAIACTPEASPPGSSPPDPSAVPEDHRPQVLERLRRYEASVRRATTFSDRAPPDRGADPYRLVVTRSGRRFGLLRGHAELVELDDALAETWRHPTPAAPTGLAISDDERIAWVVGELEPVVVGVPLAPATAPERRIELPQAGVLHDLAKGPGHTLYVTDRVRGQLLVVDSDTGHVIDAIAVGRGAQRVQRVGSLLLVQSLLEHALCVFALDERGAVRRPPVARVELDGPIWSFAAAPDPRRPGQWALALGAVEDHPLDRTIGSFGYVDSYLYLYRLSPGEEAPRRVGAVNLSEHRVVTPKAVRLEATEHGWSVVVAGYGSDHLLTLTFDDALNRPTALHGRELAPGVSELVKDARGHLLAANPLLDRWVDIDRGSTRAAGRRADRRPPELRLGEALLFTTLIAPNNRSEGASSRFTCETCHFEGGVDGRVHHSGRGDVRVSTKPLRGLFNNRPYFSRAVDHDLTEIADNEFAVANRASGHTDWFTLQRNAHPWLADLGVTSPELSPELLRFALMRFLMSFDHRPNPFAQRTVRFSPAERRGAELFQSLCEGCHQARVVSDDPSSRVAFERWEALTLARGGPIVWGLDAYEKTGIEPYVHRRGARVPSLRRLYEKWPYFTNGSARSLEELLERVRQGGDRFRHTPNPASPSAGRALAADEREALLAFLRLL